MAAKRALDPLKMSEQSVDRDGSHGVEGLKNSHDRIIRDAVARRTDLQKIREKALEIARSEEKQELIDEIFHPKFSRMLVRRRTDTRDLLGRALLKYPDIVSDDHLRTRILSFIAKVERIKKRNPLSRQFRYSGELIKQYKDVLDGPGELGEEQEEQPPELKQGVRLSGVSTKELARELSTRDDLPARTREQLKRDAEDMGRPRWEYKKAHPERLSAELLNASAPMFLKVVWADVLSKHGEISKNRVRQYDPDLMGAVERYINNRKSTGALLDAEGLHLTTSEAASRSQHQPSRPRKVKGRSRLGRNSAMRD